MPNKTLIRSCGTLAIAFAVFAVSSSAEAGFQWVSPQDGAARNSVAVQAANPVVINASSAPVQQPVVQSQYAAQTVVPGMASQNAAMIEADIIQGFASNVPLSLALRQVLPAGRSFLIEQGIETDTLVSYRGGKSWRETVQEMLRPAGLTAYEQGNVVTIRRAGMAQQIQPMPMLQAQPQQMMPRPMPMQAAPIGGNGNMVISAPMMAPQPMMGQPVYAMQPQPRMQPDFGAPAHGSLGFLTVPGMQTDSYMMADAGNVGATWSANRGDTLRKVLESWAARAGFELKWIAEYDYPMEATVRFNGSFEDAVRNLLAGFDGARPQPVGSLHNNAGAGQRVLVIQTRGNNYSE